MYLINKKGIHKSPVWCITKESVDCQESEYKFRDLVGRGDPGAKRKNKVVDLMPHELLCVGPWQTQLPRADFQGILHPRWCFQAFSSLFKCVADHLIQDNWYVRVLQTPSCPSSFVSILEEWHGNVIRRARVELLCMICILQTCQIPVL